MSRKERAGLAFLSRQKATLEVWGRSLDNMISETPKGDARHWELIRDRAQVDREIREKEAQQKELNRNRRRVRQAV